MNCRWSNFPVWDQHLLSNKHVSNKPTSWNDVFFLAYPFLSPSQGTITYHIPILKVAGSRWFSSWSQGRGIGFQWPCCFAENHWVLFFPTQQWPNQKTDQTGLWCLLFWTKTDPTFKFGCIPIGFPSDYHIYLLHLPNIFKPILTLPSFMFHYFGIILNVFCHLRVPQAVANLGQNRPPQSSLTLWHRWAKWCKLTKLKAFLFKPCFFGNVVDVTKWMKWIAELGELV